MKKILLVFAILCAALFSCSTNEAQAVNIRLHGRAGATYENGKLKVCPGFTFNVCAVVNITWQDIVDALKKHEQTSLNQVLPYLPNVIVTLYNEKGIPTKDINCRITYISEEVLDNPDFIYGEQILFTGNPK